MGLNSGEQSFVAGTSGQILAKAKRGQGRDADPALRRSTLENVDTTRTHWPFLRDRRIDAYGGITKRLLD